MPKSRTLEEISELVAKTHGTAYTYKGFGPKVRAEKTVIYTCQIHGEITQTVSQHLKIGCGMCARVANGLAARETLETFTVKARAKFADKFDYLELYTPAKGKARIKAFCKLHGAFDQLATWHLTSSYGCPVCAKEATPRGFAAHSEESWVARAKAVVGDKYLAVVMKNSRRFCRFTCDKHGVQEVFLPSLERGGGCQKCGYKKQSEKRLTGWSTELEQELSKIHGGKYVYGGLGIDPRTGKRTVVYTCEKHGGVEQPIKDHMRGYGCRQCWYEANPLLQKDTLEAYTTKATAVHGNKYKYLEHVSAVRGTTTFISAVCEKHGEFVQAAGAHLGGNGCPKCGDTSSGFTKRYNYPEYVLRANKVHADKFSYKELMYGKPGQRSLISLTCPKHGDILIDAKDHLLGSGCPKCSNRVSKPALVISAWLTSVGVEYQTEVRLGDSKLFWDIVIPDAKLAIEYHGLYWHSSEFREPNYHLTKHKEGLNAGYRTIHIFSDEWENRQEQVKALLLSALGKTTVRVFARTCSLTGVSTQDARTFLDRNHVQGYRASSSYLGLVHAETLVALVGYELRESGRGKAPSIASMEITRYATAVAVVGGFSKLLSALLKAMPLVKTVYSFSDIRMYTGGMYATCGFVKAYELRPDYFYTKGSVRFHKSSFQKSRFKADPELLYEEGLTEIQLAKLNKLYRVYDCGKVKWVKFV
jgi:hypothetical protein